MIKLNEYIEGKVKSLSFEINGVEYTTGVMVPGEYSFNTKKEEHITVTVGEFEIRRHGTDWKRMRSGETIVIPASSTFDLKISKAASYVGMYK
jgi:uncharacterized protein YaiE (UPF0345 family)